MFKRKLPLVFSVFFASLALLLWVKLIPAASQSQEASAYVLYLPIVNHYGGNPMDQVSLYPPANHYLNFQPRGFSIEYGANPLTQTVTSQTFIVHASQTGLITGWLFVNDRSIYLTRFEGQPFRPGEIIQATATNAIGTAPLDPLSVIHPSLPMVWQYPIPTSGGSGMMEPGNTPALGSGEGTGLAVGDLDGDHDGDVLVAYLDHAEVWLNDGTGSFSLYSSEPNMGGTAVGLGDLDNDLDLDAVFATAGAETVWLNNGAGTFASHQISPTFGAGTSTALALGDLNGDGYLDVVVANTNGEPETVWLNDGTGGFQPQSSVPFFGQGDSTSVAIGDVDGNFTQDVVVANANGEPETVWVNNGSGALFAHPITATFGAGDSQAVRMADLDLDGDLDVVIANTSDEPETVWLNDGTGVFRPHPSVPAFGAGNSLDLVLGDLNGDHYFDVLVANGAGEAETVWLNDGAGGFTASSFAFGQGDSQAVALWDADGDGDLDVGVVNAGGEASTFWVNDEMRVVATVPAGSGGVASNGVLTVTFDRAVDPASVGNDSVVVNGAFTGRYTGTFTFPAANQVVFTPNIPFKAEEKLSVSLTAGIRDAALNLPLRPYVWAVRRAASDGTGTFAPHPSAPQVDFGFAYELNLGDLNGDQSLDVISKDSVWLNDGAALFSAHPITPTLGPQYFGLRTGDLDGDGDLDMINQEGAWDERFLVWFNDGTGGFHVQSTISVPTYIPWNWTSALADFDGDGDLDFMGFDGQTLGQEHPRLWLNVGGGNFVPHPVDSFTDRFVYFDKFEVGDLDNDGDQDLLTVLADSYFQLWLNDGRGVFTFENYQVDYSSSISGWGSRLGDIDSDTDLDIVINRQSYWYEGPFVDFPLFLNDGNARFNLSPNSPGPYDGEISWMALGDINGDGFLDILSQLYNEYIHAIQVLTNDGFGAFNQFPVPSVVDVYYHQICMGDLDGDGDVDFIGLSDEDWTIPQAETIWLNQNE